MPETEIKTYRTERRRFMSAWQRTTDRNAYSRLLNAWSKVKDAWDTLTPDEQKKEAALPHEPV